MSANEATPAAASTPDQLYRDAATTFGAALERLARAYEADADLRRDLLQEIHVALWRSFTPSMAGVRLAPGSIASPTMLALFVGLCKLNQRTARCLQRKIDELNGAH